MQAASLVTREIAADVGNQNAAVFITFLRRSHVTDAGIAGEGGPNLMPTPSLPVGRLLLKIPQGVV